VPGATSGAMRVAYCALRGLPDVPAELRIAIFSELLERHEDALRERAMITVRGKKIRISRTPSLKIAGP